MKACLCSARKTLTVHTACVCVCVYVHARTCTQTWLHVWKQIWLMKDSDGREQRWGLWSVVLRYSGSWHTAKSLFSSQDSSAEYNSQLCTTNLNFRLRGWCCWSWDTKLSLVSNTAGLKRGCDRVLYLLLTQQQQFGSRPKNFVYKTVCSKTPNYSSCEESVAGGGSCCDELSTATRRNKINTTLRMSINQGPNHIHSQSTSTAQPVKNRIKIQFNTSKLCVCERARDWSGTWALISLCRIFLSWMCLRPRQIWTNQSTIWETYGSVSLIFRQ